MKALNEFLNEGKVSIPKFKDIPEWAKYVAQHSDGQWWFYEDVPSIIIYKDGSGHGWKNDGYQLYAGVTNKPTTKTYHKI